MYNSLPDHGRYELPKKALSAMRDFRKFHTNVHGAELHWKDSKFNATADMGKCLVQVNGDDCGMCVAGTALSLALGLQTAMAPAVYPPQLRSRWHDAIKQAHAMRLPAVLDETFLRA